MTTTQSRSPRNPLIVVVGATGTGKSQLAVELALRFNGEIINSDAMQLYDGLPVMTNKITEEERKSVPHHLLGCVGLNEQPWRADVFVKRALETVSDIRKRGKLAILVGGTHYYTQSLIFHETLIDTTSTDDQPPSAAPSDESKADKNGEDKWPILQTSAEEMLSKLREVDPVMAARWHPGDIRKIRRSLQIWLQTGRRASDLYAEQEERRRAARDKSVEQYVASLRPGEEGLYIGENDDGRGRRGETDAGFEQKGQGLRFPTLILWTHMARDALHQRLESRTHAMMDNCLVTEAIELDELAQAKSGPNENAVDTTRGIFAAIGYKEFRALLDARRAGEVDESKLKTLAEEGGDMTTAATRRYAKTQVRWIRIKLVHALREAGAEDAMVVLDATDAENWNANVLDPAVQCANAFVEGNLLPIMHTSSDLAKELLTPQKEFDLARKPELWVQTTCDSCSVTAVTEQDWQTHLKSHRHRQVVRRKQKRPPKPETGLKEQDGNIQDESDHDTKSNP